MRFKQYIENDASIRLKAQEDMAQQAMMKLYYQHGLTPSAIATMNAVEIGKLLPPNPTVDPIRFASMVKFAARMVASNDQISPVTPED